MIPALIPARSGSKRVPDKNIRELNGVPLMAWSICDAIFQGWDPFVSTDSQKYAEIAEKYGAKVIFRSEKASSDSSRDLDVVQDFLEKIDSRPEFLIYLRPTTLYRNATVLLNATQTFLEAGEYATSLRSVEVMGESAYKCFLLKFGYLVHLGGVDMTDSPNQEVVQTYRGNGYIDIIRSEYVLKGDLWGPNKIGFVTPRVVEIDTEEDWVFAEWLGKRNQWKGEFV